MTAKEARKLSEGDGIPIKTILESIKNMANAGYTSATFDSTDQAFRDIEINNLLSLGYIVDKEGKYITVYW